MHLLLTLDVSDPLIPLELEGVSLSSVPLYYPLRYGFGGGEAQYRVVSDQQIELLYVYGEPDEEEYPFMDEFPQKACTLEPIGYEQFRALLMHEQSDGFETSSEDKALLKTFGYAHLVQIGGRIFPMQGDVSWQCRNSSCPWSNLQARLHIFARVSATPFEGIHIFDEEPTFTEIYFGLCRSCGTVVTVNRCL